MAGRVVVTGCAGMLGGHLATQLTEDGHDVLGVDLRLPSTSDIRGAVADIRDTPRMTELLTGADAVVHCASALPSYPVDQIGDVIVEGTRSVLTASAFAGVGRVVHISTTAVYGLPNVVPTQETYPREPVDAYGRAKAAAEEVAEWFRSRGMCVSVLRPKTFLGPGRMGLFAMLFEWAEEGRNFPVLGTGDVRIQMLAIEDLIAAVAAAVTAPPEVASDTYNIAAAEFDTLRADFQAVLDMAGHGRRVVPMPARPALAVLGALERTRLSPVYGRLQRKLLADSYVSIDKAHERLGFKPRLSNRDAILGTYAWWRQHHRRGSAGGSGRTSRDAWRQGALSLAKLLF
jgi:nucleoside-diphosphate-sugar epimerase